MRSRRATFIVMALLAILAGPIQAQQTESVLTRIPGDCLGFLAIGNIGNTGAAVSRLANDVTGDQLPGSLLDMLKMQLRIGPAFNDNGGLAVIVLSPAMLTMTPDQFIQSMDHGTADNPAPLVLLIPGRDPASIFAAYAPQLDDGFITFTSPAGPLFAKPLGDYSVLGFNKTYVQAVIASGTSMADTMAADHQDMFLANDVILHVNMDQAAPLAALGLDKLAAELSRPRPVRPWIQPGADPRQVMAMYAKLLPMGMALMAQMDAASFTFRIDPNTIVSESLISFKPDSVIGKALAAVTPSPEPMFDRLPGLPYIIAAGGSWATASEEMAAMQRHFAAMMLDALTAAGTAPPLTSEKVERLMILTESLNRQVTGMQMYEGSPPPGSGVFGFSAVLTVRDAEAVMAMMPEMIEMNTVLTKAMLADIPNAPAPQMRYVKAAVTIEGVPVDIIEISQPIGQLDPEAARQVTEAMAKIYGEPQLTLRIAAVAADRIVMSFGGGEALCAEAIRAAKVGGPLGQDPDIAAAMAMLPRKPMFAAVFSAPNTLELIKNAVRATVAPENLDEAMGILGVLSVETTAPAVYGLSTQGAGVYQTVVVPSSMLGDIFRNYRLAQQMMMQIQMQRMNNGNGGGLMIEAEAPAPAPAPAAQPAQPIPDEDF